jgi:hypothetical protein
MVERSNLGEHHERMKRGGRLARRGADVRLERMAKAAVRVAVGAEGVENRPTGAPCRRTEPASVK